MYKEFWVLSSIYKKYRQMKLKSLIKEELNDMVREVAAEAPGATEVKDNRLKFVSLINAEFHNYEGFTADFDTKVAPVKITLHWGVSFMVIPEGISQFIINENDMSVEGQYILQMFDKHTDELMQETPKNIAEIKWNFRVTEAVLEYKSFLFVSKLIFDFKNNICEVKF
jgi:hypothetical protein